MIDITVKLSNDSGCIYLTLDDFFLLKDILGDTMPVVDVTVEENSMYDEIISDMEERTDFWNPKDDLIKRLDDELNRLEAELKEKEYALKEREAALKEREAALKEKNSNLTNKDEVQRAIEEMFNPNEACNKRGKLVSKNPPIKVEMGSDVELPDYYK